LCSSFVKSFLGVCFFSIGESFYLRKDQSFFGLIFLAKILENFFKEVFVNVSLPNLADVGLVELGFSNKKFGGSFKKKSFYKWFFHVHSDETLLDAEAFDCFFTECAK
jgi:hypothetical protein